MRGLIQTVRISTTVVVVAIVKGARIFASNCLFLFADVRIPFEFHPLPHLVELVNLGPWLLGDTESPH